MNKYDAVVLLGTQPDLATWEFPAQIHECARQAAKLLKTEAAERVIVSGRWSLRIERGNLGQPFHECDKLAELLMLAGVDNKAILRESDSMDTISNLYCVKTQYLLPNQWHNIILAVASFRVPRLQFLARKILGPAWRVAYESVPDEGAGFNEALTMRRTKEFLSPMRGGDHEWLADKFFEHPFYAEIAEKHRTEA